MTGEEIIRAFGAWAGKGTLECLGCEDSAQEGTKHTCVFPAVWASEIYPLYIGAGPSNGRWYVRERMPGTRVWRTEDDGSFTPLAEGALASWMTDNALLLGKWRATHNR